MKNKILLYSLVMCLFSFSNWAQEKENSLKENKNDGTAKGVTADNKKNPKRMKVKYYHVEEIVPIRFGGRKTVYDVTDPKLIETYDLGPDNKRTVTPVYEEIPQVEIGTIKPDSLKKLENAKLTISDQPKKKDNYAYIDIVKTYERVADKGYESIDMLKIVANSYFFNDEFEKAEKCYSKLFSRTSDLAPEYFYRYAITLKAVGKVEESNEYLKKFNLLSAESKK